MVLLPSIVNELELRKGWQETGKGLNKPAVRLLCEF